MSGDVERYWRIFVPLLRGDGEAFLSRLGPSEENAAGLLRFLRSNRLAATAAAAILDLGIGDELPPDLLASLRASRRTEFVQAVENLRAVVGLHELLTAEGIRHLFLKGPLLALRAYGGVARRTVGDIDLLVAPAAVDAVERLLVGQGYEKRFRTLGGRRLSRFFTHHFAYATPHQMVEVHWHLVREAGIRVDMEAVWAEAELAEFRGVEIPVPGLETSLLLQVLSLAKHLELGAPVLRSLADTRTLALALAAALGDDYDWSGFLERLAAQGAARLAPVCLELVLRQTESHVDLPQLAATVAARLERTSGIDRSGDTLGLEVFANQPPAWDNKRALFPLHRRGRLAAWTWWLASLPVRRAVYSES